MLRSLYTQNIIDNKEIMSKSPNMTPFNTGLMEFISGGPILDFQREKVVRNIASKEPK